MTKKRAQMQGVTCSRERSKKQRWGKRSGGNPKRTACMCVCVWDGGRKARGGDGIAVLYTNSRLCHAVTPRRLKTGERAAYVCLSPSLFFVAFARLLPLPLPPPSLPLSLLRVFAAAAAAPPPPRFKARGENENEAKDDRFTAPPSPFHSSATF